MTMITILTTRNDHTLTIKTASAEGRLRGALCYVGISPSGAKGWTDLVVSPEQVRGHSGVCGTSYLLKGKDTFQYFTN